MKPLASISFELMNMYVIQETEKKSYQTLVLSSTTSDLDMKEFVSAESAGSASASGPASLLASSYLSRRNR